MKRLLLLVLLSVALAAHAGPPAGKSKTLPDAEVRRAARKLAYSYIETASTPTMNWLAYRTVAFAGMVRGLDVVLDGHRLDAARALLDSGLTLLQDKDHYADARAIRNTVAILMELSAGRATKHK
jgi:hypothetical protein